MNAPPPPHLLANYVQPWGPSAKHSSVPACLHANRARVLLPFGVMKVSTSAICVRGRILGDIPGRGSQRVHHRRYRRHDVRRSNFSAARRRRNSPRRPINDHHNLPADNPVRRGGGRAQELLKRSRFVPEARNRDFAAMPPGLPQLPMAPTNASARPCGYPSAVAVGLNRQASPLGEEAT